MESTSTISSRTWRKSPLAYGLMILGTLGAFALIRWYGESLTATQIAEESRRAAASPTAGHLLFHILLALTAVVLLGRFLGALFKFLGQPPVIGEVVAGIVLGPSVLGAISPAASSYLLPSTAAPALGMIAQIGVVLYMFCVGLDLDPALLRKRGSSTIAISHASIVVPFLLGAVLSLWLYPRFAETDVKFTVFALFVGAAMSITAFPVLARILTDRKMSQTPLGIVAITCAAADDATAWCLLALVVGVARDNMTSAFVVILLSLAYVAAMFWGIRPALRQWAASLESDRIPRSAIATVLLLVLASALATEAIGIHAIFGGFLLGAMMPHDSRLATAVRANVETLVTALLLPAFFAFTGMRTELGLVSGAENWFWCAAIVVIATLGKLGGTMAAARVTGMTWNDAASLGVLMNTRGLMELVVLNIGLDLGIITPTIFAMMVVMALATTVATTPVLGWLHSRWPGSAATTS